MNRMLWFAAGAGAGLYAAVKARRAAEALTADGLADRMAALSVGARLFGDEVRAGAAEKEIELRERLSLAPHGRTELSGAHVALATSGPDKSENREGND